jgi:hypothetical protein
MPTRKYCAGCKKLLEEKRFTEDTCSRECAVIYARHIKIKLDFLLKKHPELRKNDKSI